MDRWTDRWMGTSTGTSPYIHPNMCGVLIIGDKVPAQAHGRCGHHACIAAFAAGSAELLPGRHDLLDRVAGGEPGTGLLVRNFP